MDAGAALKEDMGREPPVLFYQDPVPVEQADQGGQQGDGKEDGGGDKAQDVRHKGPPGKEIGTAD